MSDSGGITGKARLGRLFSAARQSRDVDMPTEVRQLQELSERIGKINPNEPSALTDLRDASDSFVRILEDSDDTLSTRIRRALP